MKTGSIDSDSSTRDFQIALYCVGQTGTFTVRFDDIYLGLDTIFFDNFESGDTTAWSSTVP